MAVNITAGSGTSIMTDLVGSDHYQVIKIDLGAAGAASPLVRGAQTAANSIPVTLATNDVLVALLDGIEGQLTTIDGRVDGIEALLTTIDGRVDGIEGLLTTIDADTGNMDTSLNNIEASAAIMDDWDNGASDGISVSGDVAHDTADAGEPVKIGGKAIDFGTAPTAVGADDRVNGIFTRLGQQFVICAHPNMVTKELNVTDADGAQTDTALVTVSAGTAIIVMKASAMADGANTGDVACRIGFGTANVPSADGNGLVLSHPGIKSGSGVVEGNGGGIIGIGASNEDLRVTCEDPAGGALNILVGYFTVAIG